MKLRPRGSLQEGQGLLRPFVEDFRMKALIKISYPSSEEPKAIAMSLAPDNLKVPPTLKVDARHEDGSLIIQVECKGSIETFISTIDEILGLASMIGNIFKGLEGSV